MTNRILHFFVPEDRNDPLWLTKVEIECLPDSDAWESDDFLAGAGLL